MAANKSQTNNRWLA